MKIKLRRVNALLLATIMLGSYKLVNAEKNDNRIEKYCLTKQEQNDENYSYLINDEEENLFTVEEVQIYNNAVQGIMDRKDKVKLGDDDVRNIEMCYAVKHSQYSAFLDKIYYSNTTQEIVYTYKYSKEKQEELLKYVNDEMEKIYKDLVTDDMNTFDKILVLYQYASKNFVFGGFNDGYIYLDTLLKTNAGICHTLAYFLDYFCQLEGIESYQLLGYKHGEYHMWNMIKLDDGYFYMFDLSEAVTMGKKYKNTFIGFGIDKAEATIYSIPSEDRLKSVKMKFKSLSDITYYETAEYQGNHIFKLIDKFGEYVYYNTETRVKSENLEEVPVKEK